MFLAVLIHHHKLRAGAGHDGPVVSMSKRLVAADGFDVADSFLVGLKNYSFPR